MALPFAIDTGSANIYAANPSPAITSLTAGVVVFVKIVHANTGASTLNVNSLGAVSIVNESGGAIISGQLADGQLVLFVYDGTHFQVVPTWLNGLVISPTNSPVIPESPIANSYTAYSTAALTSTTASSTQAEFAAQINFTSNQGYGSSGAYKQGLFVGIDGQVGTGPIWGANLVAQIGSDVGSSSYVLGLEIDVSNQNMNYDALLAANSSYGLYISGKGFRITSAIEVNNAGGGPIYNYGLSLTTNSITTNTILDQTSSYSSLEIASTHIFGVNATKSSLTYTVACPNSAAITWSNFAGTALINGLLLNSSNNFELGFSSGAILCGAQTQPSSNDTFTCGASGATWSAIWATNGTIQTSDPALKTDIAPLPSMLPLISRIEPKTFKWIVGGTDFIDAAEDQSVQETQEIEYQESFPQRRNDRHMLVTRTRTRSVPLFDDLPMHDEMGKVLLKEDGSPLTYPVPRMVNRKVAVKTPVHRPRKRTHWGFLAPDVKAAFDELGIDFGGYVRAENGTHHLRPDQLIPVLWKAVQELAAEVDALRQSTDKGSKSDLRKPKKEPAMDHSSKMALS